MRRPTWAGAPGFTNSWGTTEWIGGPTATRILRLMQKARVVCFSPDQVAALPYPESGYCGTEGRSDAHALMDEVSSIRLPFEPVFVDIWRSPIPGYSVEGPGVGALFVGGGFAIGFVNFEQPDGSFRPGPAGMISPEGWGTFDWAREDPAATNVYALDQIDRAAACLRLLESVNVTLREMPMRPKDRNKAVAKGRRIPLTISIRPPSRRTQPRGGGRTRYSHRFEVRGHYMRFTRGPIFEATAPADRCYVPGVGECRQVWCPPHIKGPEDAPLILKLREFR